MKVLATACLLCLVADAQAFQFPFKIDWNTLGVPKSLKNMFGYAGKEPKELPDKKTSFRHWEAEGIYAIRVSQPQTEGGKGGGHHGEGEGDLETENLRMYGFSKIYNGQQKKFRIDAFPISSPEMTPEPFSRKTYQGPLVIYGDGDEVYLVKERLRECEASDASGCNASSDNDVTCRKLRMEFQQHDPLKHADYRGLTFEHNVLCHRYENIDLGHGSKKGSHRVEIRNSELYLDAFDHEPVELHVEGRITGREENEEDRGKGREYRRFLVHIFVNEFEFDPPSREEKELLSWPNTLREVCKESSIQDLDDEDIALLQAAGL